MTDTITTVAYLQDLPATVDNPDADSRTIQDLEVWGDGSLIIAEPGIIWQLSPGGDTLIVAGQGTVGSTGNNGPATDAGIGVRSIAADTTGNLFIGDSSHTIRVVSGGILLIEPEPVPDPEPPVTSVPDPDFDSDGSVGFQDFLLFAAVFGKNVGDDGYDSKFDLDGSVDIGFGDFLAFAAAFGT